MKRLQILWIRDSAVSAPYAGRRVTCADDVARIATEITAAEPVEVGLVFLLDSRHHIMGYHVVARGTLNAALVHPREVFKAAFLANAESIVFAHNHPSGDPVPSPDDDRLTWQLREAGRLLGVDLLDHVVVTDDPTRSYSYAAEFWRRALPASKVTP